MLLVAHLSHWRIILKSLDVRRPSSTIASKDISSLTTGWIWTKLVSIDSAWVCSFAATEVVDECQPQVGRYKYFSRITILVAMHPKKDSS